MKSTKPAMPPTHPPDPPADEPEITADNSVAGEEPEEAAPSLEELREVAERLGAEIAANDDRKLVEKPGEKPAGALAKDAAAVPPVHMALSAPLPEDAALPLLTRQLSFQLENRPTPPPVLARALAAKPPFFGSPPQFPPRAADLRIDMPPAPHAIPPRLPRAGEVLKKARIAAGYSLEQVAAEIKIKPQHLLAIEEGRAADLPSRTHAVGFVRVYAEALALNGAEMAARFRTEAGSVRDRPPPLAMPEPVSQSSLPGAVLVTVALVCALVIYLVGASVMRPPSKPAPLRPAVTEAAHPPPPSTTSSAATPEPVPPPAAPAPSPEAPPPMAVTVAPPPLPPGTELAATAEAPPAPPVEEPANTQPQLQISSSRIRLEATEDTSVQIFDAEGALLAERNIRTGEAFFVPDKSGYTLATSNAGALRLRIDGKPMPPIGEEDEAMHNIPLNAELLMKYLQ